MAHQHIPDATPTHTCCHTTHTEKAEGAGSNAIIISQRTHTHTDRHTHPFTPTHKTPHSTKRTCVIERLLLLLPPWTDSANFRSGCAPPSSIQASFLSVFPFGACVIVLQAITHKQDISVRAHVQHSRMNTCTQASLSFGASIIVLQAINTQTRYQRTCTRAAFQDAHRPASPIFNSTLEPA